MRKTSVALISMLLLASPCLAASQTTTPHNPADGTVIQAEGSAQTDVQNDFLSISLALEKESPLLPQLNEAMQREAASALAKAKKNPEVKTKTSGYSIYPVYEKGVIVRQHATYRISLETKNFDAGLSLAAAMQPFQISNLSFSVSPQLRKATEKTLFEKAVADLRDNFSLAADTLAAKTITITNLTIGPGQYNFIQPRMMMRGAGMAMEKAAPMPAEAGESQVSITVSGSALVK
jgi:predicted secreted protein